MARTVYCGIDIGTYHVKVVIAAPAENPDMPMQILGTGTASSRGMRHGYIIDRNEATKSVKEALARASSSARVQIRSARVGLGGVGIDEIHSTGDVTLTPSGGIVTQQQIDRAMRESEKRASPKLSNRTVIHTIPLEYRVDGQKVYGKPEGMQGTKLAIDTLLITMLTQHHDDLVEAVESSGVEVEGVMVAPLAAALVTLTKAQKTAGVCLANIGAETLSIIVFEDDNPISIKVLPTGSADITNTIALSFQIPLPEAEQMKRGAVTGSEIPIRKMDSIVQSRLKEMFKLIAAHLKTIGRAQLLPAGIVITGGGSGMTSTQEIAKAILKLPSQVGQIGHMSRSATVDATWAVAFGLCKWAYADDMIEKSSSLGEAFSGFWDSIKRGIKNLLP
ncbi:MAG: cell division protein FtsA [Candidatus Pacebacteria bacterium]|nr:cell division protein FtsA [Candidatus Paceibacterota bacterium]